MRYQHKSESSAHYSRMLRVSLPLSLLSFLVCSLLFFLALSWTSAVSPLHAGRHKHLVQLASPGASTTTSDNFGDMQVGQDVSQLQEENKANFTLDSDAFTGTVVATSVDWGDYDRDGDLDLAVGTGSVYNDLRRELANLVYRNDQGKFTLVWLSDERESTRDIAWGDYDGDGYLDLAVGSMGHNRIYHNDNGMLTVRSVWTSTEGTETQSIAWADYDGDTDLDLAVGNGIMSVNYRVTHTPPFTAVQNVLYVNEGRDASGMPRFATVLLGEKEPAPTASVEWGDYNGDGKPDLAVGNAYTYPSQLYLNVNGSLVPSLTLSNSLSTLSLAWGDYDSDGDLDLALGNGASPDCAVNCEGNKDQIYKNKIDEDGTFALVWTALLTDTTTSVAWGDYDYDGKLDLFAGNATVLNTPGLGDLNRLYLNKGETFSLDWWSQESEQTMDVKWGDYDNDGDLDLAAGNTDFDVGQPIRLYRNESGTLAKTASPLLQESDWSLDAAWGDFDNDGDLDVAVANRGQPSQVYRNRLHEDGAPNFEIVFTTPSSISTTSIAWGDIDNDKQLDLLMGNGDIGMTGTDNYPIGQPNFIYRNKTRESNSVPTFIQVWDSASEAGPATSECDKDAEPRGPNSASDVTASVAWADYDGDGDLDFAVGNGVIVNRPTQIYRNDGKTADEAWSFKLVWCSQERRKNSHVAWGDYDGDGDLDLAVANRLHDSLSRERSIVYQNQGSQNKDAPVFTPTWESAEADDSLYVAWGDYDNDGDLDLAFGNRGPNRLYRNDNGVISQTPAWSSQDIDITMGLAWGDYDGDGDLDLAAGNGGFSPQQIPIQQPNRLYRNDDGVLTTTSAWTSTDIKSTTNVAWGDYNGDGDLDLLAANAQDANVIYENRRNAGFGATSLPIIRISQPGYLPQADLYSSEEIWSASPLSVAYTLTHSDSHPVQSIRATYSLVGGGTRPQAIAATGTQTIGLSTSAEGTPHTYYWDVYRSGVMGQSDNVVFQLQAIPAVVSVTYQIPGPYLYGSTLATTLPFRVRGNQVRVVDDTGEPVPNALVYHVPAGETVGTLIGNSVTPYRTDAQGYLQGRGALKLGEQLLALAPVSLPLSDTQRYADMLGLYHTNGTPTELGVETWISNTGSTTVTQPGEQVLRVSAAHPLMLFNLDVALEWDSSKDPIYLQQLAFDLKQASKYLYDFTNGQVALGRVRVAQDADNWGNAHLVVHATNHLRPYAVIGGAVFTDTRDFSSTLPITYGPGQVHIGSVWNRYGEPNANPGVDWPLVLAHELGHYLLFLEDTYLGLDIRPEIGGETLINVDSCYGSAMGDIYGFANTEFIADDAFWQSNCSKTLAAKELGRNEWQTITGWFPWLITPTQVLAGPNSMPFAFTTVEILNPMTPTTVLANQDFYLNYENGETGSSEARAFLLRDDNKDGTFDYIYDLGSAVGTQNLLHARGAQPDDRLCIFDRSRQQYSCEDVKEGDERIALVRDTNWNPVIQVTPVNSTTFNIQVVNQVSTPANLSLKGRLYPEFGTEPSVADLNLVDGIYSGTLTLSAPALSGHVHVWNAVGSQQAIVAYSIGGNPGNPRSAGGGDTRGGGGNPRSAGGGDTRGGGGNPRSAGGGDVRPGDAPLVSPDGKLIFFATDKLTFAEGQFFTVQDMAGLPPLPFGKQAIGQAYNLVGTGFATNTAVLTGSVSFQYIGTDVLTERMDENQLTIHFWNGVGWRTVATYRDPIHNLASARSQGPGVYALLAGITTPSVYAVEPAIASNNIANVLTIRGEHFLLPVTVLLVGAGQTYTLPLQSVSTSIITAIVPAGWQPNEYQVIVLNDDQPGGPARSPLPGRLSLFAANSNSCFYDFFESGAAKWERSGDWEIVQLANGTQAMTDSSAGPYKDASDYGDGAAILYTTSLTSPVFSVANCPNPVLTFQHDYTLARSAQGDDMAKVEMSTDGGATWVELVTYIGGGVFGEGIAQSGIAPEWTDVAWKPVTLTLPSTANDIRLRFSLVVNNDRATSRGWIIDNVQVGSDNSSALPIKNPDQVYQVYLSAINNPALVTGTVEPMLIDKPDQIYLPFAGK